MPVEDYNDKKVLAFINEKITLYGSSHAGKHVSLLLDIIKQTEETTVKNYHLTFYKHKKELLETLKDISENEMLEMLSYYPKLLNGIYIDIINDDAIGNFLKIQFGYFIKNTIENISQIEGINLDEYFKILSFVDRNTKRFEKENEDYLTEIYQILDADTKSNDKDLLIWNNDKALLKTLSKKLYNNKHTAKPMDFFKAIDKAEKINWLREPETLAYLVKQLYVTGIISCSAGKGYIKVSNIIFCDYSQKIAVKFDLKKHLDKITRSKSKYSKQKAFVDSLIKFLKS